MKIQLQLSALIVRVLLDRTLKVQIKHKHFALFPDTIQHGASLIHITVTQSRDWTGRGGIVCCSTFPGSSKLQTKFLRKDVNTKVRQQENSLFFVF